MLDIEIANNFINSINNDNSIEIQDKITIFLKDNPIVLFMKGIKDFPACGFSSKVVYILNQYNINYIAIDVLQSSYIRDEIKKFTNWPTIPQLYVKEVFIGGCDIISNFHLSNKLQAILQEFILVDDKILNE